MVVIVVFIGCATGVITAYFKSKEGVRGDLIDRVERLEESHDNSSLEARVRALEAIVTDSKSNLKREINDL